MKRFATVLLATALFASPLFALDATQAKKDIEDQVYDWRTNPFEPHRIANYRTVAYQKTVVMKYLDNLTRIDGRESRRLGVGPADVLSVSLSGELAVLLKNKFQTSDLGFGTLARVPIGGGSPREVLDDVSHADWGLGGDMAAVRLEPDKRRVQLEFPLGGTSAERRQRSRPESCSRWATARSHSSYGRLSRCARGLGSARDRAHTCQGEVSHPRCCLVSRR